MQTNLSGAETLISVPNRDFRPPQAAKRIRDAAERRGVPVANVIYNPFDRTEIERKIGEGYKLFSVFLDVQLFRQSLERLYDEVRAAL
jgi:hypothetical protein